MNAEKKFAWRRNVHREPVAFVCTDFAGITRGRAFHPENLQSNLKSGVGWVPINQIITAFDKIPDSPHWGSHGDLRLLPDVETATNVDLQLGAPPLRFYLCNITNLDGSPWDLCTRSYLNRTQLDFAGRTGCRVSAAFEHEFVFLDQCATPKPGFSLRAARQSEPFASFLLTALEQAGQEPEMYLAEFGENQFEFTCAPTPPVQAADRAVIAREVAHDVALQLGQSISFSPRSGVNGVGNGMHIHMSLKDSNGRNALYDVDGDHRLSAMGGSFAAGIIHHLPAILAFTAPSVLSYYRLVPQHWSSAYTCFGDRNREAALRICPIERFSGDPEEAQFHFEYRSADATANPYLALAVVLRAGLAGIEQNLPAPPVIDEDPHVLDESARRRLNVRRLPETLAEALAALHECRPARDWFTKVFLDSYLAVKYSEIATVASDDEESLHDRYVRVF